jgi:hypothetical protein
LPAEEERTHQDTQEPKAELKEIVLFSPGLQENKHILVFHPSSAYRTEILERSLLAGLISKSVCLHKNTHVLACIK